MFYPSALHQVTHRGDEVKREKYPRAMATLWLNKILKDI